MTRLLGWLGDIGADPNDDVDTRKRKALLVYLAVLILPISLVWGVLYLALVAPSGVVAFAYMVVSVVSIGLFARTRNFELLLRNQLLDITLAPTLSMWPTAGFLASGEARGRAGVDDRHRADAGHSVALHGRRQPTGTPPTRRTARVRMRSDTERRGLVEDDALDLRERSHRGP